MSERPMLGGHHELRRMIEWWLTLPSIDPPYQHRTLEQRNSDHAWALAYLIDMYGYKKDHRHPGPPFKTPGVSK